MNTLKKNGNKYLIFASADKKQRSIDKLQRTLEWNQSKDLIDKLDDKPCEYEKDFMKIKFNLDDNLPLNKK